MWEATDQPDPFAIAATYAAVTGDSRFALHPAEAGFTPDEASGFGIAGEFFEKAVVVLGWNHPRADRPLRSMGFIGQYDPTRGWIFPEEYVPQADQLSLAEHLGQRVTPAVMQHLGSLMGQGAEVVNVRLSRTARVRLVAAELLQPIDLDVLLEKATVLAGRPETPTRDDYTICYPILASVFETPDGTRVNATGRRDLEPGGYDERKRHVLALCFRGLRRHTDDKHTVRFDWNIPLAERSTLDDRIWVPDPSLIGIEPTDWVSFKALADFLDTGTRNDRAFSPEHCAIGHNLRRRAT